MMMRRFQWVPVVALLSLAAGGCITSPPGMYGATAEAKKAKLKPCPHGLIDDLEDGESQIVKQEDRDGYWYTFADTEGSTIAPRGNFVPAEGGVNGSKYAARMKGHIAASGKSLYAGMGASFHSPKSGYDGSKYKGISFWAKGPGKVRFKTPDIDTDPVGDRCSDCYNHFGVDLYLTDQWTRYTIPFEKEAQQQGWGDQAPGVATNAIFGVEWQYGAAGTDYDIWIDDVQFVGCE